MNAVDNVRVSIGTESTIGTAVAPTVLLPITGLPGYDREITNDKDPAITGTGMDSGEYASYADCKGSIDLSPRSCGGWGKALKGALGTSAVTATEIVGIIRLRYTGSSASCKITTDLSAKTINSKIGAAGAEANDAAFGTTGTITLTGTSFDTVAELVAAIEAYTDYECKKLTGLDSSTIVSVYTMTGQAKSKWVVLVLTGTGTGAYAHRLSANLTANSERAGLTLQIDGREDNMRYAGNVVQSLDITAALKAQLKATVNFLGMTEAIGQSAMSALTLGDAKPYVFATGITSIAGTDYNFTRDVSLKINTNHIEDGYGQSSLDRAYQGKGKLDLSGSVKLRLDSTSYLERAKDEAGTRVSLLLVYYAADQKCVGTSSIREMMVIELPFCQLSKPGFEASGQVIDMKADFNAYKPNESSTYIFDEPITIWMTSADSAAY